MNDWETMKGRFSHLIGNIYPILRARKHLPFA